MNNKIFSGLIMLCVVGLIASCSSYSYYSVGNGTEVGRYRTFAWLAPPKQSRPLSDFADQRIREAATSELENRGLRLKARNPDLLVRYEVMVNEKERVYDQPVYNYVGGGYYPRVAYYRGGRAYYWVYRQPYPVYVGSDVERIPYREGTLIIDIINRKTGKVIWRGYGVGEVENRAKAEGDIPKVVANIIGKLPMRPAGNN